MGIDLQERRTNFSTFSTELVRTYTRNKKRSCKYIGTRNVSITHATMPFPLDLYLRDKRFYKFKDLWTNQPQTNKCIVWIYIGR